MPRQIYTVEIDGKEYDIEGDRPPTEEEARAAVGAYTGATAGVQAPPSPEPQPGFLDRLNNAEGVTGVAVGAGKAALNTVGALGQLARKIPGVAALDNLMAPIQVDTESKNTAQSIGKALETGAEIYYGGVPIVKGAGKVVGALLPSTARSGQAINAIEQAAKAKNVMVNVGPSVAQARRVLELGARGGRRPGAAKALVKEAGDTAELPFKAMRDYTTNIKGTAREQTFKWAAPVRREMTLLQQEIDKGLRAAADTIGEGEKYVGATAEYAKAMKLKAAKEAIEQFLIKRLLPTTGLAAVGKKTWDLF